MDLNFQVFFDLSPSPMCVADGERFVRVNQSFLDLMGYTQEEITSRPFSTFLLSDEQTAIDTAAAVDLLESGEPLRGHVTGYETRDGKSVWIVWNALPVQDDGLIYAAGTDITRQRKVEQQLGRYIRQQKRAAKDLKRSNRDLEQFAYAASHDLQTPLRKVCNFAAHLKEEFGDRLDDPMAQKYLTFIVDGAATAQELINGLLYFSRTGRELDQEQFDLDEALDEALFILEDDIKEKGVQLKRCDLPQVFGDKTLLARVFQNLVGNAIKFRSSDRDPEVRVCVEDLGDEWQVYVADNGVGFDMRHGGQIFVIFRRLSTEKNGSGLGLALCKRIIERHGGRIWAESDLGKGSTFYFTLPKERRDSSNP